MLVLSTRLNEKILLPDTNTAIEVVSIQSGAVRLGISAPEDVRILRENVHDKVAEWGPAPVEEDHVPDMQDVKRLIDKRLEIARTGMAEASKCLRAGREEDARVLLEKIDEDLHLLRRRVRREFEKAASPCGLGV